MKAADPRSSFPSVTESRAETVATLAAVVSTERPARNVLKRSPASGSNDVSETARRSKRLPVISTAASSSATVKPPGEGNCTAGASAGSTHVDVHVQHGGGSGGHRAPPPARLTSSSSAGASASPRPR